MKKIITFMAMLAIATLPFSLTSCDEDHYYNFDNWGGNNNNEGQDYNNDFWIGMAQTLSGQWRGDLRAYKLDKNGYATDSIDYSTDIEFVQSNNNATSGTGTQYDFEAGNKSGNADFTRDFTWYIDTNNGDIYITYKEQNGNYMMKIAYNDLNLNDRTFTGLLYAADGGEVDDFFFNRFTSNAKKVKIIFE